MSRRTKTRPRAELIETWKGFYDTPPPKGLSTRLLHMACAYNDQVKQHGGLKKSTLRDLRRYAKTPTGTEVPQRPAFKPTHGTRLVREWRGQTHVVDIQDDCIKYNGEAYSSLSQVARAITGVRWSGPRFFGM